MAKSNKTKANEEELHDEDFDIISRLEHKIQDKLVFIIFSVDIMLTGFLAGYIPQHYYIVFSIKMGLLMAYRWYTYKQMKYHYFMLDFCYISNILVLLYLWLPHLTALKGHLFPIIFSFSNGPVLGAIVMWKNSLVPHSVDKMTSISLHISPSIALWGIRWYATGEQGFILCRPSGESVGDCQTSVTESVLYPLLVYLLWQTLYIIIVFFWRKERIANRQYETSYTWIVERNSSGAFYPLFVIFGEEHRKLMYIVWNIIYTLFALLLAYPCNHSHVFHIVLVFAMLTIASCNGASFYIDLFRYIARTETEIESKKCQ